MFLDLWNNLYELVIQYWQAFLALGGVSVFLPALISLLKKLGIVGEGDADQMHGLLQAFLFLVFIGLRIFLPDLEIGGVDAVLKTLADVIIFILSFLGQFGIGRLAYKKLWKGRAGVFGFYYS